MAVGAPTPMRLAGLIALSDPPRADADELIKELHTLGVRTVMVTGDAPATATIIARAVGLDGAICPPGPIPERVCSTVIAFLSVSVLSIAKIPSVCSRDLHNEFGASFEV